MSETTKKTILVIDDDASIREMLQSMLEESGFNVILKENGAQGFTAFQNNHVDLIITDIIMPGQEGIETIQAVRQVDASIPIIAISGTHFFNSNDYSEMVTAFGANYTICKPFKKQVILSTIDICLK